MEASSKIQKGEVVVIPFPYSDLSASKRRPALVITQLQGKDVIICQITGKQVTDQYCIGLEFEDFETGNLNLPSNIRPDKLFTAEKSVVEYRIGKICGSKMQEVEDKIFQIIQG